MKDECNEFKKHMSAYISGEIDQKTREKCEKHMENCCECLKLVECKENELFLSKNEGTKNFKHLKLRFIKNVVLTVIGSVLLLALVFNFIVPMVLGGVFHKRMELTQEALKDFICFTTPGYQVKSISVEQGLINMTTNCKYQVNIVGEHNLFGELSVISPNLYGKPRFEINSDNKTDFLNYEQISNENYDDLQNKWDKLENLKDFTVTQMSVFFKKPLSANEVEKEINGSIYNYIWFEIETGDYYEDSRIFYSHFGFPYKVLYRGLSSSSKELSIENASKAFQSEMKNFESHSSYLGIKHLDNDLRNINDYISKNGIKIKAVVLESDTEDLLELRENNKISNIKIINVDFNY